MHKPIQGWGARPGFLKEFRRYCLTVDCVIQFDSGHISNAAESALVYSNFFMEGIFRRRPWDPVVPSTTAVLLQSGHQKALRRHYTHEGNCQDCSMRILTHVRPECERTCCGLSLNRPRKILLRSILLPTSSCCVPS